MKFCRSFLGIVCCLLCAAGVGASAQLPEAAPVNPEFVTYAQARSAGKALPASDKEHAFGWIPAPVSITHRSIRKTPGARELLAAPASYDLRPLGRLTPVRNQNPWGTCWSFATFASMESCLLPGETRDFSEKNLVNLHGFDYGYNAGGHGYMSMAYLTRWGGPVNEADDPYPSGSWATSTAGLPVQKHVQQVYMLPGKASDTDNDAIKQAVTNFGAVHASYYHNDTYYNATYKTYNYNGASVGNHAVAIVGWDDNFDRTRFGTVPAANGAYIVRNSWGTGWGESGYYYVSYYDTVFARSDMFVFPNAASTGNYTRAYQYDPLGWVTSLSTPWAAAIYTAT